MELTSRALRTMIISEFKKQINIKIYRDIRELVRTIEDKDMNFLRKELKLYLTRYNSKTILINVSILIHSIILLKYFDSYFYNYKELQKFLESFVFVEENSYESLKNDLMLRAIGKLKSIIENSLDVKFLLILDSALKKLQNIELLKEENILKFIEIKLFQSFNSNNIMNLAGEFVEFNKRFPVLSEEIIRRMMTSHISNFPYLADLKISDPALKSQIQTYITNSVMLEYLNTQDTDFIIKRFEIPVYNEILNFDDYQVHSTMTCIFEKNKSKKFFFKVLVNTSRLVLKAIILKTTKNSEYKIFNLIKTNYTLSLPQIQGISYSNEEIFNSFNRPSMSLSYLNEKKFNVLKFFFESFDLLDNQIISSDTFISNLNSIITTLQFLNENNLRVPIIFINSFGISSGKIFFIDFQNIQTSKIEKFPLNWLESEYQEYLPWLRYIGVDNKNSFYTLETLQCWSLAGIIKIKTDSKNEESEKILNLLTRNPIRFQEVKINLPGEDTDSVLSCI